MIFFANGVYHSFLITSFISEITSAVEAKITNSGLGGKGGELGWGGRKWLLFYSRYSFLLSFFVPYLALLLYVHYYQYVSYHNFLILIEACKLGDCLAQLSYFLIISQSKDYQKSPWLSQGACRAHIGLYCLYLTGSQDKIK